MTAENPPTTTPTLATLTFRPTNHNGYDLTLSWHLPPDSKFIGTHHQAALNTLIHILHDVTKTIPPPNRLNIHIHTGTKAPFLHQQCQETIDHALFLVSPRRPPPPITTRFNPEPLHQPKPTTPPTDLELQD